MTINRISPFFKNMKKLLARILLCVIGLVLLLFIAEMIVLNRQIDGVQSELKQDR